MPESSEFGNVMVGMTTSDHLTHTADAITLYSKK